MGFFDFISDAVNNFDTEKATDWISNQVERKEKDILNNFKKKLRSMDDQTLLNGLRKYDAEERYDATRDLLEAEIARRGLY